MARPPLKILSFYLLLLAVYFPIIFVGSIIYEWRNDPVFAQFEAAKAKPLENLLANLAASLGVRNKPLVAKCFYAYLCTAAQETYSCDYLNYFYES